MNQRRITKLKNWNKNLREEKKIFLVVVVVVVVFFVFITIMAYIRWEEYSLTKDKKRGSGQSGLRDGGKDPI